jgi:hypothetical protein
VIVRNKRESAACMSEVAREWLCVSLILTLFKCKPGLQPPQERNTNAARTHIERSSPTDGKMFDQPFRRTIRGKLKMLMVVGICWEHVGSAVFVKRSKAISRT